MYDDGDDDGNYYYYNYHYKKTNSVPRLPSWLDKKWLKVLILDGSRLWNP